MATVDGGELNPGTENQPGAGENQPVPAVQPPQAGVLPAAQPPTPAEKTFSFKEDRSDWIPRTRLNEESGKRTKLEQQVTALNERLEMEQRRVRAAMGL